MLLMCSKKPSREWVCGHPTQQSTIKLPYISKARSTYMPTGSRSSNIARLKKPAFENTTKHEAASTSEISVKAKTAFLEAKVFTHCQPSWHSYRILLRVGRRCTLPGGVLGIFLNEPLSIPDATIRHTVDQRAWL